MCKTNTSSTTTIYYQTLSAPTYKTSTCYIVQCLCNIIILKHLIISYTSSSKYPKWSTMVSPFSFPSFLKEEGRREEGRRKRGRKGGGEEEGGEENREEG